MEVLADSPQLLIYLSVFIGPFIQEDAAVFYAAALSANDATRFPIYFAVITAGLFVSDIWKYWIGWGALKHSKVSAMAQKKQVLALQEKVQKYTFTTLLTARFVPLARVPAYIACGLFKVPYWKYCLIIAFTAVLYTIGVFMICHILGEVVGEKFEWLLPVIGLGIVLIIGTVHFIRWRLQKTQSSKPIEDV